MNTIFFFNLVTLGQPMVNQDSLMFNHLPRSFHTRLQRLALQS